MRAADRPTADARAVNATAGASDREQSPRGGARCWNFAGVGLCQRRAGWRAPDPHREHEFQGIGRAQRDDVSHGPRVAGGTGLRRVRGGQREDAEEGVLGVVCGGGGKVGESFGNAHV